MSMKTKHTKGPWKKHLTGIPHTMIILNEEKHIATLEVNGIKQDEVEANARLIAAAPEMLEALEEFLDITLGSSYDPNSATDRAVKKAEAVLKKARGES